MTRNWTGRGTQYKRTVEAAQFERDPAGVKNYVSAAGCCVIRVRWFDTASNNLSNAMTARQAALHNDRPWPIMTLVCLIIVLAVRKTLSSWT
jgi:hypothetical protein